ncbi:retrotransposon gag domain-containing protein, partial [Solirubrobacter sp. CPCC 204708]|nr:retrotransposon gag domain-containing protein [Solirubrobacter deserti]
MRPEMIRLLPEYQGFDSENPYSHMRDFEDVCSAFLSTGSPLHIICLVLFPFSLKENAKRWFHSLTPNSIFNWEDMRNAFLNKFFPPARTNALMRAIQNFTEKQGESFASVWERYKELLNAIPHHGLEIGQIIGY